MESLDDVSQLTQQDPSGALQASASEWEQLRQELEHKFFGRPDQPITQLVIAGMGGSALAAGLAKDWLQLPIPVEVVRTYDLPAYVGQHTLVIASSFSGNTEETLSCARQAIERQAQLAVTAGGGKLLDLAKQQNISYVVLPKVTQPRMGVFANLLSIVELCQLYGVVDEEPVQELRSQAEWLKNQSINWLPNVPTSNNLAKQIAQECGGKIPLVFANTIFDAVAYKWKITFNETGKNVSYYNVLPEFDHNELTGWTSHPIEKPFSVFQLRSNLDHPQISKRFDVVERLLAGKMPTPVNVQLQGETFLQQILWACVLADFAGIYLALVNGADPVTPTLVEELKKEL